MLYAGDVKCGYRKGNRTFKGVCVYTLNIENSYPHSIRLNA